ncbi:uncharacterized protein [Ambystoma mexicanum]|uniref:uncharacterized protein n=1 Tax=Ambystoma mexicanum TaxID=8296 RepID=UPI0037E7E53E
MIRNKQRISSLNFGETEVKVLSYADNMVVVLSDPGQGSVVLKELLERVGRLSGYKINWDKTEVFPLSTATYSNRAPGGKINKPKTVPRKDLGKNIFERRCVLSKRKHQKHKITGAKNASPIEDLGLIATHPLKKLVSSTRDNIRVSEKQHRKLLKKIKHMEKEKASMDVEAPSKSRKLANTMEVWSQLLPRRRLRKFQWLWMWKCRTRVHRKASEA